MAGIPHVQGRLEFSRMALARRLLVVQSQASGQSEAIALSEDGRAIIGQLQAELAPELERLASPVDGSRGASRWLDRLHVDVMATNARPHGYEEALGSTRQRVNPIVAEEADIRYGVPVQVGSSHTVQMGPYLTLSADPVMRLRFGTDSLGSGAEFSLDQAYARLVRSGFSLDLGRSDRSWTGSRVSSLVQSGDARAPVGIRLGRETAVKLPSVLGILGPIDAEIFWGDLGRNQAFPGENVAGWRVTMHPHPSIATGMSLVTQYGGEGAPQVGIAGVAEDLFMFWLDQSEPVAASNKFASADMEISIPSAAGLTLYGQLAIDDFDTNPRRFRRWLIEAVGHVYGFELNRLTDDADLTWYGEYQHTGYILYQHFQNLSGWTHNGVGMGSKLGSDGDAVYTGVVHDVSPRTTISLDGAWEDRSNDIYIAADGEGVPGDGGYVTLIDKPNEYRMRVTAELRHQPTRNIGWRVRGGFENVRNFAFRSDDRRTHYLLEMGLKSRYR